MKNKKLTKQVENFIEKKLDMDSRVKRLREKFDNGEKHPFYISLFGEENAFLPKVTHSVYTWFGQSFYESFCKMLGESVGYKVETQKKVLGYCNKRVEQYLTSIEKDMNYSPNRVKELKTLKKLVTKGPPDEHPDSTVDVYITTKKKKEILIDITTVGNNKKSFRALKKKILMWTAMRMSQRKDVDIECYFAIPYNPYTNNIEGTEYDLWGQYYDRDDILVGDELWKKVSNNNIGIKDVDSIFKEIGKKKKFI